jgi:hypothetical protein
MSEPAVADPRSAYLVYTDSCDLEDEILKPENVRVWANEFASRFSIHQEKLVLRGVGDGGERLIGALSYLGTLQAEIACRSTDYTGRTVALVFTTAVSPVGLDRVAAQCRALGASRVEAWGCAKTFEALKTDFLDDVQLVGNVSGGASVEMGFIERTDELLRNHAATLIRRLQIAFAASPGHQ